MAEKRAQRSPPRAPMDEDDDDGALAGLALAIAAEPASKRARVDSTAIIKQVGR